jgi:hypothetical protein
LQQLQWGTPLPVGADLTPLKQLQQLTELHLSTQLHVKTASCLASLTGLKQLKVTTRSLPDEALMRLTALTSLTQLHLRASDEQRGVVELSSGVLDELHKKSNQQAPRLSAVTVPGSCWQLQLLDNPVGT